MTQYLVDNSLVLSNKIKFVGNLAPSATELVGPETVTQFGSLTLSIKLQSPLTPVSFVLQASNDPSSNLSTDWNDVGTFEPVQEINTYNVNLGYRRIRVNIVAGASAVNGINFLAFYSTSAGGTGPTLRTIDDTITNQDLLALGRNVLMGRGKLISSSIQNTTVASDSSLKVTKGSKLYALDEQENLNQQVKLQMLNNIDQKYIINAGTVNYTDGSLVMAGTGATDGAIVKSSGNLSCSSDSVYVFRGAATFTSGSGVNSTGAVFFGDHSIGLGTSGTAGFGLFVDTTGSYPLVTLEMLTSLATTGDIIITLGGTAYTLVGVSAHPDRPEDAAAAITEDFNALANSWRASQAGTLVYFTSLNPIAAGAVAVDFGTTGATGTITATNPGASQTLTFIDRASFNCDKMAGQQGLPAWASGDYVEFEISVFGAGRYYKLAIVDKETQDLVDVQVGQLPRKFGNASSNPIRAQVSGPGAALTVYNSVLYSVKDPNGTPILSSFSLDASGLWVAEGALEPVLFLSKKSISDPVALVKKMIIMNNGPGRVQLQLAKNGLLGGEGALLNSTEQDNYIMCSYRSAGAYISPITVTDGRILVVDNVPGNQEIPLDIPLEAGNPLMLSLGSGSYVPGSIDISFIIEYYN